MTWPLLLSPLLNPRSASPTACFYGGYRWLHHRYRCACLEILPLYPHCKRQSAIHWCCRMGPRGLWYWTTHKARVKSLRQWSKMQRLDCWKFVSSLVYINRKHSLVYSFFLPPLVLRRRIIYHFFPLPPTARIDQEKSFWQMDVFVKMKPLYFLFFFAYC